MKLNNFNRKDNKLKYLQYVITQKVSLKEQNLQLIL